MTTGTLITGAITIALLLAMILFVEHRKRNRYRKPVVCVCEVNGKIGLVLRQDLDNASRAHWAPYCSGNEQHDPGFISAPFGINLEVSPMFVFSDRLSDEFRALVSGCFVEKSSFEVPRHAEVDQYDEAKRYLYG